jgi:alpha-ribazole phosphatase
MSEILFIRHAETDMTGRFCGHSDPELNEKGHGQVVELIDKLREENIDTVYTSDLRRAHTTASEIAKSFDIDCYIRPGLREIFFGTWEGHTWEEIEQLDAAYAGRWIEEFPKLMAPGGEDIREFERRVLVEVEVLSAIARGRKIAVVTHAGPLRIVLCTLNGCSLDSAWKQTKPHCSIVRHAVAERAPSRLAEVNL